MMRVERIGRATLYLGDSLEIMPSIKRADVIADPPYAVPTQVAHARVITRNAGDLSIAETAYRVHANEWARLAGDEGRVFVCCDGASYPSIYRAMFSLFNLALLVWDKGQIGMGREFRKSHELIAHGWKPGTPIYGDGIGRADVLRFPPVPVAERIHPAQKPVAMLAELVRVCGPVILDPTMASGSTGEAALSAGREYIGIEIDPTTFDLGCERLENYMRQATLL